MEVAAELRADVLTGRGFDYFSAVPCSALAQILNELPGVRLCPSEDHAVAMAVGAAASGRRACSLMQNSGMLACLSVMTTLVDLYCVPLLVLVTTRPTAEEPEHSAAHAATIALAGSLHYASHYRGPHDIPAAKDVTGPRMLLVPC